MKDDIRWVKTHCARLDHGGCSLMIGVKDNRIVKVKGDPQGFLNMGYVCVKGSVSHERLTHPDRLKYPLKRIGDRGEGRWETISWDEAIKEICENFNRIKATYGAKALHFVRVCPRVWSFLS